MVLLWETGLALLDIQHEEASRYPVLRLQPQPADISAKIFCQAKKPQQLALNGPADTQPFPSVHAEPATFPQAHLAAVSSLGAELTKRNADKKRKRGRTAVTAQLNDKELQALKRQQKPQAAVSTALEQLRAWLQASGHATVAAALQAEAHACTARFSLHQDTSLLPAGHASSEPVAALPCEHCQAGMQSSGVLPASVHTCPVCLAAWQCLSQENIGHHAATTTASPSALQLGSSCAQQPLGPVEDDTKAGLKVIPSSSCSWGYQPGPVLKSHTTRAVCTTTCRRWSSEHADPSRAG